jgi:hypothetical protein
VEDSLGTLTPLYTRLDTKTFVSHHIYRGPKVIQDIYHEEFEKIGDSAQVVVGS